MLDTRPPDTIRSLTGLAMWLLDVPFEPASPAAGELFDTTMEHLSEHLVEMAHALGAGRTPDVFRLTLPPPDPPRRRRDQMLLRRSVLDGRHPVNTSTLIDASVRCRQAVVDLTAVRRDVPTTFSPPLALATSLLAGVVRAADSYRRSAIRLQRALIEVTTPREHHANLAARAERDLIRHIRRAAKATYGVRESSTSPRHRQQIPNGW